MVMLLQGECVATYGEIGLEHVGKEVDAILTRLKLRCGNRQHGAVVTIVLITKR